MKIQAAVLLAVILAFSFAAAAFAENESIDSAMQAVFPDWKGYTDDTLAMNSMYSFIGYHGQGTVYVQISDKVDDFRMYVNGHAVQTDDLTPGS